jgi:hypothetical protein
MKKRVSTKESYSLPKPNPAPPALPTTKPNLQQHPSRSRNKTKPPQQRTQDHTTAARQNLNHQNLARTEQQDDNMGSFKTTTILQRNRATQTPPHKKRAKQEWN